MRACTASIQARGSAPVTTGSLAGNVSGEIVPAAVIVGLGYIGYKIAGGGVLGVASAVVFPFAVFTGIYLFGAAITGKT